MFKVFSICFAAFGLLFSSSTMADEGHRFFTLTFENDIFVGEDNGFTNGIGFTVGRAGFSEFSRDNTPGWVLALTKRLPIATQPFKLRGFSNIFFQRLQTPNDITDPDFNSSDLPYAGLAAWQGTMYASDSRIAEQLSLTLGLVGPSAAGEPSQKTVHAAIGSDQPLGWRFQIRDTPVIELDYQRIWSFYKDRVASFEYEVIGLGGLEVGNLKTATKWGVAFRTGTNLQQSIGAFSLKAGRQVNPLVFSEINDWYAFIGGRVGYVPYDILLDGRLPDGLALEFEREETVSELALGMAWSYRQYAFVIQLASSSSPIDGRSKRDRFGAFSLTLRF